MNNVRFLLVALFASLAVATYAQPQWRFHLAFEDGTGAKDTLWFIYDTSVQQTQSHWPVDMDEYHESRVGLNYDDGEFHVFTINDLIDSTNSMAFPYYWFPMLETGGTINAINWEPPMTIRWDTSLFHAPYLPYEQGNISVAIMDGPLFFFINNHIELQAYDMLIDDSVFVWDQWDYLFSFGVSFGPGSGIGMNGLPVPSDRLSLYPNPAWDELYVRSDEERMDVTVLDAMGHVVLQRQAHAANEALDLGALTPGLYVIHVRTTNHHFQGTFQKGE